MDYKPQEWLKEHWFKIGILIIIGILAIGVGLYLINQSNLQSRELQDKITQETQTRADQISTQTQDYAVKQKANCLSTYEAEGKKFNNVESWSYNSTYDECEVFYKDASPKSTDTCIKNYTDANSFASLFASDAKSRSDNLDDEMACFNGEFINRF